MKYFHLPTFLISLSLGLIYVYLSEPKKKKLYVYPEVVIEDSKITRLYKDKTNKCFHFTSKEVKCSNSSKPFPIQS